MRTILAKDLKIKFIETLSELGNFSYEDGNPFLCTINKKKYFVFLKNLSPAYFKGSPDITRIQLPSNDRFSKILSEEISFVVLGYDIDNDTFVSWNPKVIRERANAKRNVSLYSRESLQANVKENEFKLGVLSTGEKILIFKRRSLVDFFYQLPNLFTESPAIDKKRRRNSVESTLSGKVTKISDKDLLKEIKPLLKKNKVLEAVEICTKYYPNNKDMTFKDWFSVVNELYKTMAP